MQQRNMTSEPYWHIHHDRLLEWTIEPIERRIQYIRTQKPEGERELRLRLLCKVEGALPPAVAEVSRAYDEVSRAYDEVWRAFDEVSRARNEAWRARNEAWRARNEAVDIHHTEIEALHALECPDCSWDGETIFPRGGAA